MSSGRIRDLPPLEAPADVMAMARENCAARLREKGYEAEADAFDRGDRDFTWAMRHEVNRLMGERAK